MVSDKFAQQTSQRALLSAFYCIGCAVTITMAFAFGPSSLQLILLGIGMFLAAASAGPAGAMVARLTPAALHGTAFAVLTLANNAFGLAPGPIVTGWIADRIGLLGALELLPFASMWAAVIFIVGTREQRPELGTASAA
jgi:MFS family permease